MPERAAVQNSTAATTTKTSAFESSVSPASGSRGSNEAFARRVDRALAAQRPLAIAFVRRLRRQAPGATPADLLAAAERWYRRSAMGTGGGVGAASVIPGVGTGVGLAIASVEIIGFLELTALYALVVAEIHGDSTDDPQRARTLVMALMLGDHGKRLVQDLAVRRGAGGIIGTAVWGELVTQALPEAMMGELGRRMRDAFMRRFGRRQVGGALGKLLPFGVGAVIGAAGNRTLANEVIRNARGAFGAVPQWFVGDLSDQAMLAADAEREEKLLNRMQARSDRRAEAARRADAKRARTEAKNAERASHREMQRLEREARKAASTTSRAKRPRRR